MTGRFGRGQAKKIAEARSNRRVNDQLGPFVPIFIDQAEILEHADFTKLVDSTVQRLDADGAHDARDEAIEHRNAHVSAVGDGVVISASGGDPVTAVELEGILDRFSDREYAIDVAANKTLWGDDAHLHELQRTPGQRRHDAIVAIFRAAVTSGESGEAAALVLNIVCDAVTWAEISHEAGLATETNLAGQRVDPFTGLERPKDLLDELTADPASILDRRCETDTAPVFRCILTMCFELHSRATCVVWWLIQLARSLTWGAGDGCTPARRGMPPSCSSPAASIRDVGCPLVSLRSITPTNGSPMTAEPISRMLGSSVVRTTSRSIDGDGEPARRPTGRRTRSEKTARSCCPSVLDCRRSPNPNQPLVQIPAIRDRANRTRRCRSTLSTRSGKT